ncbi:membrane protein [Beggiatoa sp. PS]|nr:membrane protein [Beggiatoa sp. PS]
MKPEKEINWKPLKPYPVSIFQMLHYMITLGLGFQAAGFIGFQFGVFWALLAFIATEILAFFVIGYGIAAFVLFLSQRYSPNSRIGYEITCYILVHFKETETPSFDDSSTTTKPGTKEDL